MTIRNPRYPRTLVPVALMGALVIAAPGLAHHPDDHPQGKHGSSQTVIDDCDGGTVTYDGPETMWPPNHTYRTLTVTAEADDPDANVELATEGTHDEVGLNGAGPSEEMRPAVEPPADADAGFGSAQTEHALRATRSGRGDGRTYTISYQAQFGDGEPCMGSFAIEVPHDMRSDKAPPKKKMSG